MEIFVDVFLLSLLVIIAIAVINLEDLFTAVMLFGIYSLVSASLFVVMDAVDVAFTEASVGAGVATVFMLSTLALTTKRATKLQPQKPRKRNFALLIVVITGLLLVYGTYDMPRYGDPSNPIHRHIAPHYLQQAVPETGASNVVSAILASYRGYDTLGETTVVFTAAVGVLLLIGGARRLVKPGRSGLGHKAVPRDSPFRDELGTSCTDDQRPT